MTKRERVLMIAVVGMVACYGLFLVVRSTLLGPLEAQALQLRNLRDEVASKKKQMDQAIAASTQLAEWEKFSLPHDEAEAQAAYQHFLFRLVSDCHFEDPQVSTDKTQKTKYYSSIVFTIRARVSLENLTEFLYRFYAHEQDLLHQIRSLSISRGTDSRTKGLNATIVVAGLALDNAPSRSPLVPENTDPTKLAIKSFPRTTYQVIAQKNIFEPYKEPPRIEEPKDPKIDVDTARHVVLTGCTKAGEDLEAWIYNRLTDENKVFRVGDELNIAGVKGRLLNISPSGIVLDMETKQCSLKLGKSFRDFKELEVKTATDKPAQGPESHSGGNGPESPKPNSDPAVPEILGDGKPEKIGAKIPPDVGGIEPRTEGVGRNRGS